MSIGKKLRLLAIVTSVVILSLMALLGLTAWSDQVLNQAQSERYTSYRLAMLLRQTSADLTQLVRAYVVTADPEFEKQYFHVDDVRSGRAPWPDGRTISIRQMLEQAGLTPEEIGKLNQSDSNSKELVKKETVAFYAVKGKFEDAAGQFTRTGPPDLELARKLVHDAGYEADRERIMAPIREFEQMLDRRTAERVESAMFRSRLCIGLTGFLVILTALLVLATLRGVNNMLRDTAQRLEAGADQLSGASSHVSQVSQTLAQGASQQAASLEETSAAAEQVRAVAQANTNRSDEASSLVANAEKVNREVDTQFDALTASMQEITESSNSISRIIRTVDEIAFQTNILALNAAVEAARAGEAGLGFAVVADEVRGLAQRAGEAAKETGRLIEEAIRATDTGKHNLGRAATSLSSSRKISGQLAAYIQEVSTASREQSVGIEGIARAVLEMQSVTQSSAASAEEAAASSEQMSAQAETVLQLAHELREAVGAK